MTNLIINGKKYMITIIDNADSIKRMIAINEKTLPEYINFTEFSENNIQAEFLKDSISKINEKELLKKIPELNIKTNLSNNELLLYWIYITRNRKLGEYDIQLQEIFKKLVPEFNSINLINDRYHEYLKNIKTKRVELEKLVKKETEFKNKYNAYEPLPTTNFIQDSVITEWKISTNYDPPELFDKLKMTNEISFASLKFSDLQVYKIYRGTNVEKSWGDNYTDNTIIIKYLNGKYTITLTFKSAELITATIETETNTENLEKILTTILDNITDLEYKILSKEELGIKGVFAIPNFIMNRYIILELLSNDPMIENYFYIDETRDLASGKSVLYLYFSPLAGNLGGVEEPVTVYLSQKATNRTDLFFINKEIPIFTEYLNIRVSRAKNLEQVHRFMKTFSLLASIYNDKSSEILKKYSKILPEFENLAKILKTKKTTSTARVKDLQAANPDLFVTGYPTKCESKKQPIPISEDDKDNYDYPINYPKDSNDWYACPDQEFPYPGFQNNKLDNVDEYPLLPCCYPKAGRPFKIYQQYTHGNIELKKKETKKLITSNLVKIKAINSGKIGLLPKNIWYILKDYGNFYRYGIPISESSFITAVATAIDKTYQKIDPTDKNAQMKYISDLRNTFAALPFGLVAQQFWGKTPEYFREQILNTTISFDSKLFINLLEKHYDIQIIVFERTETDPNATLELPNFSISLFTNDFNIDKKTILIYKHLGIRSDHLKHPHYELIIKDINNPIFTFKDKDFLLTLKNLKNSVYSSFMLNNKFNTNVTFSNDQIIDNFGKVVGFLKNNIYIATNPINPYGEIIPIPKKQPSLENIKKLDYKIKAQEITDHNTIIGLAVNIPNITYSVIPLNPNNNIPSLSNIPIQYNITASLISSGLIEKTMLNKKIADFILQLASWSYSIFVKSKWDSIQNNLKTLAIAQANIAESLAFTELVNEFINTKTIVIPDHDYKINKLDRKLTNNNNFFNKDNQLILDSDLTKSKLVFYLKHNLKSIKIIDLISSKLYLTGFYTHIHDFIQDPNVYIIIGPTSFDNWLLSLNNSYITWISNILNLSTQYPIFFKHPTINNNKLVIIQNVINGDLNRAISVSYNFTHLGINTGFYTLSISDPPKNITIYEFKNKIINKLNKDSDINILKYSDNIYASILFIE